MVHLPSTALNDVDALAAMLRGDRDGAVSDALLDLACAHGVDALIAHLSLPGETADVARRVRASRAGYQALAAIREAELRRVLSALAAVSVDAVVIKGAHLAHVLYASSALRPRSDTDLVIHRADRERAERVLSDLGYRRAIHVRGDVILGQWHFTFVDAVQVEHALDLHWRIAAPLVFRHVLPPHVLRASAVPIAPLGSAAFGPSRPHALLIACVHLIAHHRRDPLLLWLYEIAQLAKGMDEDERQLFVDTAARDGVTAVCVEALRRANRHFEPHEVAALIGRITRSERRVEPSARLLSANCAFDELWLDLQVATGWRERVTLVNEHLWPDADYMQASGGSRWLPAAYVARALRGAIKWTTAASDRRAAPAAPSSDSSAASASRAPLKTSR